MAVVEELLAYQGSRGNEIEASSASVDEIRIEFTGSGNRVVIADGARLGTMRVSFDCDNGLLEIAASTGVPKLSATIRIGQDGAVAIGANVSCTSTVGMSATEGTRITIGDDVMFASDNQLRADDGHAIFDVRTDKRVNVSRLITIGNHVWVGRAATVLSGVTIGDGSVVGYGAIVTRDVPNNCVVAGVPARVVRRDIAWERPHLSLRKPYYKPDASTVTKSAYWRLTEDPHTSRRRQLRRWIRRSRFGDLAARVHALLPRR